VIPRGLWISAAKGIGSAWLSRESKRKGPRIARMGTDKEIERRGFEDLPKKEVRSEERKAAKRRVVGQIFSRRSWEKGLACGERTGGTPIPLRPPTGGSPVLRVPQAAPRLRPTDWSRRCRSSTDLFPGGAGKRGSPAARGQAGRPSHFARRQAGRRCYACRKLRHDYDQPDWSQ